MAVGNSEIALSFRDGSFGAVANACNHAVRRGAALKKMSAARPGIRLWPQNR
jgi:hypothetical protein